ncbi:PD-(D/E)XK motif protein [uncultured Anaeromusa sp.]|uniref:PD-(D/E)XK motif protein n=1 Tax=uncultured Anaeromusa sp. TaxID=673273 RepID=UPI0029C79406|nr:PD-(D/E)XK motif protein [uncultured Anaeromusa sp.]
MIMTFSDFKNKWNTMEPIDNGYLSLPLEHPLEFHIGYYSGEAKSLVLLNSDKVSDMPPSYAIKPINSKLNNDTWILELRLIHNSYEEVYLRLCWDLIETSRISYNPKSAFIKRYLVWQKLLQCVNNNILPFQRQKGLLGELLYLLEMLKKGKREQVLKSWLGPEGCDQDFVFDDTWSEIKTVAMAAETVNISSLQQLDCQEAGKLVVYFLEKTTSVADCVVLPQIVEEVRDMFQKDVLLEDLFDMKLFMYGYREEDVEEYSKNKFKLIEKKEYCVGDDFPKLIRKDITPAITSCSYSLSLAALDQYKGR